MFLYKSKLHNTSLINSIHSSINCRNLENEHITGKTIRTIFVVGKAKYALFKKHQKIIFFISLLKKHITIN